MKKLLFLCFLLSVYSPYIYSMALDEYMGFVLKKNKYINSYDISIQASKEKQIAGDIALTPVLSAGLSITTDKSEPILIADKRTTSLANIGLSKKFSTGTTLSLSADTTKYEYELPVIANNNGYSKGGLGVGLQQSLWKDFFGVGVRLRQERELMTSKLETFGFELKKRGLLIEAESDFWDYIVAQENLKLKEDNFERAKKLDSWTSNRVYNGISDQSDLLQVRALMSLRELELTTAKEDLKSNEAKIKENIDFEPNDKLPVLTANLTDTRSSVIELSKKKNIVKIESYLSTLEAEVKQKAAEEVLNGLKPDLLLTGRYNTSAYDLSYSEMQKNIGKTDRPVTFVGLSFSWLFDSEAKSSVYSSAQKEALALKYKAEQAKISGENAWQEHLRRYELAKQNILILEKIARLQRDRVKAEQSKFSKGRTITSSVVNAETDSAEAEVNYLKAKSGLRKLEAATQLFISLTE